MMETVKGQIMDDIDALASWAESLDQNLLDVNELTFEETAGMLQNLRSILARLKTCDAAFERWIAEIFKDQRWREPHEVANVGVVDVKRSTTRRQWDHEALLSDWFSAWMEQRDNPEPPTPHEVRDALFSTMQVSAWKVKQCRAVGIDVDEYCDATPGAPRVTIAGPEERWD